MSAKGKLVERFKACPTDFTRDELVRMLRSLGYQENTRSGSRRKFHGHGLPTISLHAPHPGKIVKQYALREVRATLESEGLI